MGRAERMIKASPEHYTGKTLGGGASLAVQWLRLCASTAEDVDLIPGWELRSHIPCGVAKKKKSDGEGRSQQSRLRRSDHETGRKPSECGDLEAKRGKCTLLVGRDVLLPMLLISQ